MANEATWMKRVADWRASGLTAAEFCSGKDFTLSALRYWTYRPSQARAPRSEGSAKVQRPRLARVHVAAPLTAFLPQSSPSPVVIEFGAFRISLAPGFDDASLGRVLGLLGSMS